MPLCPICTARLKLRDLSVNRCWSCHATLDAVSSPTGNAQSGRRISKALQHEQHLEDRLNALVPVKVLALGAGLTLASLLISFLPALSKEGSDALRGVAAMCVGLYGLVVILFTWWHRMPIKVKGALSPERPFFYHVGAFFLTGVSLLLFAGGTLLVLQWLGE